MRELSDPDLIWRDGVIPVSSRCDDPYYSREGGLAESTHVFLSGVNLPRAWVNKSFYTLVELGFGTGLNFLTTWRARRDCSHNGRLNFVSIENVFIRFKDLYICLYVPSKIRPQPREKSVSPVKTKLSLKK